MASGATSSAAPRERGILRRSLPILVHQFSLLTIGMLALQPRAELLMEALAHDSVAVGRYINRGAAMVAVCDLLLSPSLGALSDTFGRRRLMLAVPALILPIRVMACLHPTSGMLLFERVLTDSLRTFGGTTMAFACFADLFQAEAYTKAVDYFTTASGLSVVFGPLLSSLATRVGNARWAYALSALLAAAHLAVGYFWLEETSTSQCSSACVPLLLGAAPGGERRPKRRIVPVWRFLRLFTTSESLRWRSCLVSLHFALEGKILQDQASILQLHSGWDASARSRWTSGMGLAMSTGGVLMSKLRSRIGQHGALATCHAASVVAFLSFRSSSFWSGLVWLVLGQQRRAPSSACVVAGACATGVGRGEAVGWLASLRAAVDAVAALLYHKAHGVAAVQGRPDDIFFLPIAVVCVAEALRWRLARADPDALAEAGAAGRKA